MKVLLLEDEESIRGFVRINLKREGMTVLEAETGEEALELARREGDVDIALLDVMLPTISGFEVCGKLRAAYPRMGIIMLTARSQEEDKIRGLELGADDYVHKPFSPGELMARLKALGRRMKTENVDGAGNHAEPGNRASRNGKVFGELTFYPDQRRVVKKGTDIVLTPTEYSILRLLLDQAGKSVSRDDILNEVWGRHYVGDLKIVDVNIRRLRQKIEDEPSQPKYIQTVWGYGYIWKKEEI
ncbi:response regulator transcription factor [Paenibacillus gansuensis]|uniref:Response regulator transcription factor n=1 Tax=Paenibacillus gansuensis TaxID=306542 RepID=A0ABW5PL64_9BACL